MRIYIFVASYPNPYKPYYDTQFIDLLRAGHDVRIFAGFDSKEVVNPKVLEFELPNRTSYFFPGGRRAFLLHVPRFVGSLARNPIARVVRAAAVAGSVRSNKARVKAAARMMTLPLVAPDVCIVHGLRTASTVHWLRNLYPGVPIAMYYHGGEPTEAGPLAEAGVRAGFAGMDLVFTNTEFSRDDAVRRGCDPNILSVLPVGFDISEYNPPDRRSYRPDGVLRLLSVGRMSEGKGYGFALEALAQVVNSGLRNVHYTIVGDGAARRNLEQRATSLNLREHVTFRGALAHAEVITEYAASDALLLPSITVGTWAETQAAVVQEALLMTSPVITTSAGGVPESIPPTMKQYCVPPCDPSALAHAIGKLCSLQEDGLRDLGRCGRAWAESIYDIRKLNTRMLKEIEERVRRHSGWPK